MSLIYTYLRELVLNNLASQTQSSQLARFLIDDTLQKRLSRIKATTSANAISINDSSASLASAKEEFYEFERVYLEKPEPTTYYLIPYNLSKLTFFIFIPINQQFKLSLLKTIDDVLAPYMIELSTEIADLQSKRTLIRLEANKTYLNVVKSRIFLLFFKSRGKRDQVHLFQSFQFGSKDDAEQLERVSQVHNELDFPIIQRFRVVSEKY